VRLLIAEMKGPVKDQCRRYGLNERFGPERFYPTVGAAVDELTGNLRSDIDPAVADAEPLVISGSTSITEDVKKGGQDAIPPATDRRERKSGPAKDC